MAKQTSKPAPGSHESESNLAGSGTSRPRNLALGSTIAVSVVAVALAVGAYTLFRSGNGDANDSERPQLDLAAQMDVPSELLMYSQNQLLKVSVPAPTAIAVAPNGDVYVVGNMSIERLRRDGHSLVTSLDGQPTCVAVSGEGAEALVYVGLGGRVVVLDESGTLAQQWPERDAKSLLTDIAVAGDSVFVADAGLRVVSHYSTDGALIGTIGQADPDRQMPGFIIPSPYFDLVIGPDEVLQVVNPGMRRVEAYNFDGELQSYWGQAGSAITDFFGCCNPAHLALLPDGRFVTSEKGIPRVKIYSPTGDLMHVVAGPRQLGVNAAALGDARGNQKERVFDVAVDGAEDVLVLDAQSQQVIVFKLRVQGAEAKS